MSDSVKKPTPSPATSDWARVVEHARKDTTPKNVGLSVKAGTVRDVAGELERLAAEVQSLRETNRRLNRRCQEAESRAHRIGRATRRRYGHLFRCLENAERRAQHYAGRIRGLYASGGRYYQEFYGRPIERLPRPPGHLDTPDLRVDHALRLIGKAGRPSWIRRLWARLAGLDAGGGSTS